MAHQIKLLPIKLAFMRALVLVLDALLPIQLPTSVPGKAAGEGLNAWSSTTYMENSVGFWPPGFGPTQF